MCKIFIFGKPGSGKSSLSKRLAAATGLKLVFLDSLLYKKCGAEIPTEKYNALLDEVLSSDSWILDGFGRPDSFFKQLHAANILIYIDLPYSTSYWFVTKRFIKGLFSQPAGWPAGSSVLKGTINSYKTLKLCPKFWNHDFMHKLEKLTDKRPLYVIRSRSELDNFVQRFVNSND